MKHLGRICRATAAAALLAATVGTSVSAAAESVTVPDVKYDTIAEAATVLQDAGLSWSMASPTVDPYCNNRGYVVGQDPTPGTKASTGAGVKISLGIAPPAGCPVRKKYLFVNVGWAANGNTPAVPLASPPVAQAAFKFLHGKVDTWFTEASLGKFPGFEFQDGGSYTIDTPTFLDPVNFRECGGEFTTDLFQRGRAAAAKAGIDIAGFDALFVYFGTNPCVGIGGRSLVGSGLWAGADSGPIPWPAIHELGHQLGLAHSGTVYCVNSGGVQVSLSNSCKYEEAGDPYSGMGRPRNRLTGDNDIFTASQLNQLGWLDGRYVTVQAQDSVSIHETLKPTGEVSSGLHAIRLLDGPTLWVEYRQPVGLDTVGYGGYDSGLVVHQETTVGGDSAFTVDLHPSTPRDGHLALPVGQTWANPMGTMKITLDSVDAEGAHITISSQLVTVPNVRNMSLQQARSAIEGAGLAWGGTRSILTTNCDLVGSIVGSEPSGNTRQPAGSLVTVTVAELDPRKRCN